MTDVKLSRSRWAQAWPDAVAFAGGLAVAWYSGWQTTDLVWSLWLSSLVVGYSIIIWALLNPVILLLREGSRGDALLEAVGGLFMLAFFSVHFGGFHFGHSIFLNLFFPLGPRASGLIDPKVYVEVVSRYWYFVPLAIVAERRAFSLAPLPPRPAPSADVNTIVDVLKKRRARLSASGIDGPYRNVMRLHLLIFFFAFAHFARLENFYVYGVVYAVYFFPWSLLKKAPEAA